MSCSLVVAWRYVGLSVEEKSVFMCHRLSASLPQQRLSAALRSADTVAQAVVSAFTACIPMTQPGPGWLVDAFLYRCGPEKGCLFLAWKGSETSVKYTNAETRRSTPWHGRWHAVPHKSEVFASLVPVKEQWTREVYMDTAGIKVYGLEDLWPTYISLPVHGNDHFVGLDSKNTLVFLLPLTVIGEGLGYTSEALLRMRRSLKRRCVWTVLERMLPRFFSQELGPPRARC